MIQLTDFFNYLLFIIFYFFIFYFFIIVKKINVIIVFLHINNFSKVVKKCIR